MKLTKNLRAKLQDVLQNLGYKVRYEKGNFIGGDCLVEQQKMVVVNKFFPLENQVNTLIDILLELDPDPEALSEEEQKLFARLKKARTESETDL